MFKKIVLLFFLLISFFNPSLVLAKGENFVSIVNPIRGNDFWEMKDQKVETAVLGQAEILKQYNLPVTWLLRFDALDNQDVLKTIKEVGEKGLFLEVTPSWAVKAQVNYHNSSSWHSAGSAFLTGYEIKEREKLIDAVFEEFKSVFGYFPKSVGAWWIDSYSLSYMQQKYKIISALIVADQYSTDNYQIWGQYFSTPYYPDKKNALHPAQTAQNKIPVVISQWAARDPVQGYGNGVHESTFSVQANDYIDYHNLDINYFKKLIEIYTNQPLNQFGSIVVGLENTYDWSKYKDEYKNQIEYLKNNKNIKVLPLQDFSQWYIQAFPNLSPTHIISTDDSLGSDKKAVWFMNPYYRVGWFVNKDGSVIRDIRQYVEGEEELCFQKRCDSVNFATSATRVLDEVSFGHKWIIDSGKISNFKITNVNEKYVISYKNEAGNSRTIEFLPRDISIDGQPQSIDAAILNSIKNDTEVVKTNEFTKEGFKWNIFSVIFKTVKFLLFISFCLLIPGLVLTSTFYKRHDLKRIFLAISIGVALNTLLFYILSLFNLRIVFWGYITVSLLLFLKFKLYRLNFDFPKVNKLNLITIGVIIAGTIFQNIPLFKNGLAYPFGLGFWGPNTHDAIWHISLINQLIDGIPPQNPIFANTILKNYHFFYDLLVAQTMLATQIPVVDLVFRFFPVLFSLLLGIGTYYLAVNLFEKNNYLKVKMGAIFGLYFVYFSGSFGWIVEYIRQKNFSGESAFWANQAISFNLNPPFAVSLIIVIAIFLILPLIKNKIALIVLVLLAGSLISFKAYAAVLILLTLLSVGIFKKDLKMLITFGLSSIISGFLLLSNFSIGKQLIIFSPFWFIHSMIDSPDRVGWTRLTLTRIVGLETKNWFKFISAETIGLFLFITGNLGMRILGLFALLKLPKIIVNTQSFFILLFSIFSFAIPILFIQSGNPWNTIQFLYYGLYTASLASGIVAAALVLKFPKFISLFVLGVIIILTPINSITTSSYYLGYFPHGRVDLKELEALQFLSNQNPGAVLTYPYDEKLKKGLAEPWPLFVYDSTAYVSALSKNPTFIEDIAQNQILLTEYNKRLVSAKDFFASSGKRYDFLKDNKIKYVYLPKMYNVSLNESDQIKKVFENSDVLIYSVN